MEELEKDNVLYILKVLRHPEITLTDEFKEWVKQKDNQELYWDMRAAYDGLSLEEKQLPDVHTQWQKLQQTIASRHIANQRVKKSKFMRPIYRWSIAISAACIIVIAGIFLYLNQTQPIKFMEAIASPQEVTILSNSTGIKTVLNNKKDTIYHRSHIQTPIAYNTIQTPRGKDFKITLSDGTEVLLNAESSLRYPTEFKGKDRTVELNGEAFFTVAKDSKHPFIVHTASTTTIVTGTKFNFRAYTHSTPHITLVEGSVSVKSFDNQMIKLNPGEDASLSSGVLRKQGIDVERYIAWTEGFFYFEEAPLSDIMRELGKWYNVNIYFNDEKLMNYHFNFWVNRNQSITKALEMLNQLEKVETTFKNNTIYIK